MEDGVIFYTMYRHVYCVGVMYVLPCVPIGVYIMVWYRWCIDCIVNTLYHASAICNCMSWRVMSTVWCMTMVHSRAYNDRSVVVFMVSHRVWVVGARMLMGGVDVWGGVDGGCV